MIRLVTFVIGSVLAMVTTVWVAALGISAFDLNGRETAKSEILAAIDRMRSVSDFDDADALLRACEMGARTRIDCRLGDYNVTYRGHRIKFSRIEVDYYRPTHGRYDRELGRYLPYMTGEARIVRRPQVQVMTIGT